MKLLEVINSEKFVSLRQKTTFLFAILVVYLFLGAFLFQLIEHEARDDEIEHGLEEIDEERRNVLEVLWSHTLAKDQEEWMEIANKKLDIYEQTLEEYFGKGIDTEDDAVDDNPWTFMGSLLYAFTSITTIGYGNICPSTTTGKITTIIYATIGVPLCLIYLTEVGKMLTLILKALVHRKKEETEDDSDDRWGSSRRFADDDEISEDFDFSLPASLLITFIFMLLGAAIFDLIEDDWDFIDSCYFCFITFSTLGFGDFLPDSDLEIVIMMVYNLAALSLCAMTFTVLQGKLETWLDNMKPHWDECKLCSFAGKIKEKFLTKADDSHEHDE